MKPSIKETHRIQRRVRAYTILRQWREQPELRLSILNELAPRRKGYDYRIPNGRLYASVVAVGLLQPSQNLTAIRAITEAILEN